MTKQAHKLVTRLGNQIVFTYYDDKESNRVLIIVSATGVRQSFYQKFAEYVSHRGMSVITFDYHGIGDSLSVPINKIKTTAEDWGSDDLESVIDFVKVSYPDKKIFILGHSIGGQLIGLAPSSVYAEKIILVGAQSGYWRFWSGAARMKMWAIWYLLFPILTKSFGYLPSKKFSRMENLPKGVADQWRKWCISKRYLFGDVPKSKLHFDELKMAITSFSIEDDNFAPKAAVDWLSSNFTNAILKRIHVVPSEFGVMKIGHFGIFNETAKESLLWTLLINEINHK
ncbi:MAG: alpha/beta fold hydrolase [Bacteroidetes bacterium CHB5]|nr:alpha/beta fold hydrolase [Bacteroidetes bacterium CHB5]